jgi:hypothetical protein
MHRSQNSHLRLAGRAADYHPGRRSAPAGPIPSNLAAQAMTELAKRASLGVRELQSTFQLGLHDAVFGGQIFVPRQRLLVHRPRYVSQDARPIHNGPPAPTLGEVVVDRPKNRTGQPTAPLCRPWLLGHFSFLTLRDRANQPLVPTNTFVQTVNELRVGIVAKRKAKQ